MRQFEMIFIDGEKNISAVNHPSINDVDKPLDIMHRARRRNAWHTPQLQIPAQPNPLAPLPDTLH
jgi:hypothetical protein